MDLDNNLTMAPVQDLPHGKCTIAHLPPIPSPPVWPRIRRMLAGVLKFVLVLVMSAGSYLFCTHFLFSTVEVSGYSMFPTLHDGDRYLLNLWAARSYLPERGDIVVLHDPQVDCLVVKRIIALSGESILLKNGYVYVNDHRLTESYLPPWTRTYPLDGHNSGLYIFGTNDVYVLGDNRTNSADSRVYGPVPKGKIIGKIDR